MDATLLIRYLTQIAPLNEPLQQAIIAHLKEERFSKHYVVLREGQTARKIYFIQQGFCRAFYLTADKEFTTWFMGRGDMMISVFSFFTQRPAAETIEALEDCAFLSMTYADLQAIYQRFPEFNLFGRIITEQYYIKSEERAIALRTLSARDRYLALISAYPEILRKASLGQIASHLGITQETLSRIRAQK